MEAFLVDRLQDMVAVAEDRSMDQEDQDHQGLMVLEVHQEVVLVAEGCTLACLNNNNRGTDISHRPEDRRLVVVGTVPIFLI